MPATSIGQPAAGVAGFLAVSSDDRVISERRRDLAFRKNHQSWNDSIFPNLPLFACRWRAYRTGN
jgi:hypothetical protein